jgi:hypothetical protein
VRLRLFYVPIWHGRCVLTTREENHVMPTTKTARKPAKKRASKQPHRWSKHVNETSDAMDLEPEIFKRGSAKELARSLKRSVEHSSRRKAGPFQSAMSMLNFYINRGGKNLSPSRRKVLERAKGELRALYGRDR